MSTYREIMLILPSSEWLTTHMLIYIGMGVFLITLLALDLEYMGSHTCLLFHRSVREPGQVGKCPPYLDSLIVSSLICPTKFCSFIGKSDLSESFTWPKLLNTLLGIICQITRKNTLCHRNTSAENTEATICFGNTTDESGHSIAPLDGPLILSQSQQTLLVACYYYGYTANQLFAGYFAYRFGFKLALGIGIGIGSVLTFCFPYIIMIPKHGFILAVITRVIIGFFHVSTLRLLGLNIQRLSTRI